jgi:uncharacterized protein (AIM24 family)
MRSGIFHNTDAQVGAGSFAKQHHRMLKVRLAGGPGNLVDLQSAVAWSATLRTRVRRTASAGALVGRGSGEAHQLALAGGGFVVVQASEGHIVAANR